MIAHSNQPTYQTIANAHNNNISWANDLTIILARSSQDIANSQDHGQDPPKRDLSVQFYVGGTQA